MTYSMARGMAEFEIDAVERTLDITVRQLRERGSDPAWIASVALKLSMECMIGLPPEQKSEFLEYAEEVIQTMKAIQDGDL